MRITQVRMSGGFFPFPKHVWSTTGGWWHIPANYKENTVKISGVVALVGLLTYTYSEKNTHDLTKEVDEEVIKRWNDAAAKNLKPN